MINMANFYDNLDLKYPEIGIAIQDIYRDDPGRVKMIIPILTPNMNTSSLIEKTIHQSTTNLKNLNKHQLDIHSIKVTNYIYVPFTKEICFSRCRDDRIIPAGSKWIVVFVGGDITKPRAIARYAE